MDFPTSDADFRPFINRDIRLISKKSVTYCGIIRTADLRDCSEEDIVDGLRDQGVSKANRISIKEMDKLDQPTL